METINLAPSQDVLLRFMLYPSSPATEVIQLGLDQWIDSQDGFGGKYEYGTRHRLVDKGQSNTEEEYIVAAPPYIRRVPHPTKEGKILITLLVCVVEVDRWTQFAAKPTY
ncbi:hypothetical protein [Fibrivirga algicola]|uniref:Uncharacterized protein n=1 Tax=Fibrivirga algicola TaxID=2950420 RepID=A0ABX0QBF5_9BACT|nr:hypothetical protein [Fibrivirga algicola]NID09391.1 hypothetical protein [Fibrivirga algicola]